jgi:hypothetical protein
MAPIPTTATEPASMVPTPRTAKNQLLWLLTLKLLLKQLQCLVPLELLLNQLLCLIPSAPATKPASMSHTPRTATKSAGIRLTWVVARQARITPKRTFTKLCGNHPTRTASILSGIPATCLRLTHLNSSIEVLLSQLEFFLYC